MVIVFVGIPGGLYYWVLTEQNVQDSPESCFNVVRNCEVIQVQHEFILSAPTCFDRFLYNWRDPNSSVVYEQSEDRERLVADCTPAVDIGAEDATFQIGRTSCFSLLPQFVPYVDAFNCAAVIDETNGTVQENFCITILQPTSDHDASLALILGSLMLSFYYLVCVCSFLLQSAP